MTSNRAITFVNRYNYTEWHECPDTLKRLYGNLNIHIRIFTGKLPSSRWNLRVLIVDKIFRLQWYPPEFAPLSILSLVCYP